MLKHVARGEFIALMSHKTIEDNKTIDRFLVLKFGFRSCHDSLDLPEYTEGT